MAGKTGKGGDGIQILAAVTMAAPLLVLIAAGGVRMGLWGADLAFETLTLTVGRYLALAGVGAAALAVVLALRQPKGRWFFAVVSVLVAGATLTAFLTQQAKFGTAPNDISTDLTEPPGFSRLVESRRTEDKAMALAAPAACAAATALPTQVTPEAARDALKAAGFSVVGVAPFRAEGSRVGFWFGLTHDAVIRIRPGQTDVRVSAREDVAQGPEACRLAGAIVAALQTAR